MGQAGGFTQHPDHGVQGIGDADDKGLGRILLDARANLLHDLDIDAQQIIPAHARLARHAGGDDDDVGALDAGIGVAAG